MQVTPKDFGSSPLKCEPDAMIPRVTAIAKDVSKKLVAEGSLLFNMRLIMRWKNIHQKKPLKSQW